jgi:predicted DNA-binding protein
MIADIVEAWARAEKRGLRPLRFVESCSAPDCDRDATTAGLCRTHHLQKQRGQPLRPIRLRRHEVRMGSLRLPHETARALKNAARAAGLPVSEVLRQRLQAGLRDVVLLATRPAVSRERTVRLGALPMPAALAERLNAAAQELGLPASEVIRRAVEVSLARGV